MRPSEMQSEKPPIIHHHDNGWDSKLIRSENGAYFLVGIERAKQVVPIYPEPKGLLGRIGAAMRVFKVSMPIL